MATGGEQIMDELSSRISELDYLIEKENEKRDAERLMDVHSRFHDDSDTEGFVESMRNKNTLRKTHSDMKIFIEYLNCLKEYRSPELIESDQLADYLARFFMNVRKNDGSEYEPSSLRCLQSSINRYMYLQEKHYDVNVLTDVKFKHSRDVLCAKMKNLKTKGKGNRPNAADSLTKEEVSILFEKGALGLGNPTSLINTMWWNNTTHFGLRSRQEHIDMKWGDVCLKKSSDRQEYLEYNERSTKTRTGQGLGRPFNPKMFSVPGDPRCPVKAYKVYSSQRPESTREPESSFYLAVNTNLSKNKNALWFIKQNMGKNKLGSIMKNMCEQCGITGRKVNHSARKTTVTTLVHNGVPLTEVMQITGHKNINSINHYSSASVDQQKRMSSILSELSVVPDNQPCHLQNVNLEDTDDYNLVKVSQQIEESENTECVEVALPMPAVTNNVPSVIDLPFSMTNSKSSSLLSSHSLFTGANIQGGSFTINIGSYEKPLKRRRVAIIDSDSD